MALKFPKPTPIKGPTKRDIASLQKSNASNRNWITSLGLPDPTKVGTSFISSLFGTLDVPGTGIRSILHNLVTPNQREQVNPMDEMVKAIQGQPRVEGSDIAGHVGVNDKWAKMGVGLGIDIATDPLTYVSGGWNNATKAEVASRLGKLAETGVDAAHIADLGIDGAKYMDMVVPTGETVGSLWEAGKAVAAADLPRELADDVAKAMFQKVGAELGDKGGIKFAGMSLGGQGGLDTASAGIKSFLRGQSGPSITRKALTPLSTWWEQAFIHDSLTPLYRDANPIVRAGMDSLMRKREAGMSAAQMKQGEVESLIAKLVPNADDRAKLTIAIGNTFGNQDDWTRIAQAFDVLKLAKASGDDAAVEAARFSLDDILRNTFEANGMDAVRQRLTELGVSDVEGTTQAAQTLRDLFADSLTKARDAGIDVRDLFGTSNANERVIPATELLGFDSSPSRAPATELTLGRREVPYYGLASELNLPNRVVELPSYPKSVSSAVERAYSLSDLADIKIAVEPGAQTRIEGGKLVIGTFDDMARRMELWKRAKVGSGPNLILQKAAEAAGTTIDELTPEQFAMFNILHEVGHHLDPTEVTKVSLSGRPTEVLDAMYSVIDRMLTDGTIESKTAEQLKNAEKLAYHGLIDSKQFPAEVYRLIGEGKGYWTAREAAYRMAPGESFADSFASTIMRGETPDAVRQFALRLSEHGTRSKFTLPTMRMRPTLVDQPVFAGRAITQDAPITELLDSVPASAGYMPKMNPLDNASREERAAAQRLMEQLGIDPSTLRDAGRSSFGKGGTYRAQMPKSTTYVTPEQRLNAGVATELDAARAAASGIGHQERQIVLKQFEDDMAKMLGTPMENVGDLKQRLALGEDITPFLKANGLATMKLGGNDVIVPEGVQKFIEKGQTAFTNDEAAKGFLKAYDKTLGYWKKWATSYNPGFHGRNKLSNALLMWSEDLLDPEAWGKAPALIQGKSSITIRGQVYTGAELMDEASKVLTGLGDKSEVFDLLRARNKYSKGMEWVGNNLVEGADRLASYIAARRKGLSPEAAAGMVNKAMYNYSPQALTSFERNVMRRFVPFYVWARRNTPHMAELLLKNPRKVTWLGHLQGVGQDTNPVDTNVMPEYLRDVMAIPTPLKDKSGNTVLLNPNVPMQEVGKFIDFNPISQLSPLLKIPLEQAFNMDAYYSDPIERFPGELRPAPGYLLQLNSLLDASPARGVWESIKKGLRISSIANDDGTTTLALPARVTKILKDADPFLNNLSKVTDPRDIPSADYNRFAALTGIKLVPFETGKFTTQKVYDDQTKLLDMIAGLKQKGMTKPPKVTYKQPKPLNLNKLLREVK